MARIQTPPVFAQIRGARSYSEQAAALRGLKDDTVGHAQRKERWVEYGILEPLVKILQASHSPVSLNGKESPTHPGLPRGLADNELVRLLCLQLIASFASGGPAFLGPIYAANAVPVILESLSPLENPPLVTLNALRALTNIADATRLASPGLDDSGALSEALFVSRYLDTLCAILDSESTDVVVQEQKCLVASLVSRLCRDTHHQNLLANASILDALATALASFVVARGEVIPGAEIIGQADGLADMIPAAAPRGASLALVLEAISCIIEGSRFRACMLISSPAIMAVFPAAEFSPSAKETKAAWNSLEMSGLSSPRARSPGAADYLLPIVPVTQSRSLSSQFAHFPPLGFTLSRENLASNGRSTSSKFSAWDSGRFDPSNLGSDPEAEDPESPLIPWLINFARWSSGLDRVMAASVLTSLYKAGLANPEREAVLGHLIVPILCQLMKDYDKESVAAAQLSTFLEPDVAADWVVSERTPGVLARLIGDSNVLQEAAYSCGAVKMACQLLKDSYEPLPAQTAPRPWSPNPDRGVESGEGPSTNRVGLPGKLPINAHKIRIREGSLKLLTALGTSKEDYRKAIVEQDVVPFIVESLSRSPGKPNIAKEKTKSSSADEDMDISSGGSSPYGTNPNSVIIAACHAIRTLSRSVSNLRTALDDHDVAMPIFRLLRHPDAEVQTAAGSVVCNLVTNSSPMRTPLFEAGILKVLCEQAHSLNPGIRLNAVWALKHLVDGADEDLRKLALEELEAGWLVRLIRDDTEDEALYARLRLERGSGSLDIDDDDDEDMDTDASYGDDSRSWVWPGIYRDSISGRFPALRNPSPRLQRVEMKLAILREMELNPTRKARNDDLLIQEQGLNFIRNLMGLPSLRLPEMVDYVLSELGDRLFDILASKLKTRRVLHPLTRRAAAAAGGGSRIGESRVLYPQSKIMEAAIYILVHISSSHPRHRQLVIAQTELLNLLGTHINHKDIGVRKALCHLFGNLSCQDDKTDMEACGQRALEIKNLGFLSKLEGLEQTDSDLDVRERAKTAVWQIKNHSS
ncbi:armadillo-type protein [Lasiosphaeria ovina]|uniref:Armadillo-type protein n=1 Tax=Lasiosphaeria ovina TaxID=92902 RepID=A0AAE0K7U5_9PEZI|nr:armadillo-type protein [Lasiosphaeria ovina]